jgi:hypothetical protein
MSSGADTLLTANGWLAPASRPTGSSPPWSRQLNGSKRLRPLLVRQAAGIFGVPPEQSLVAGLAVEAIHCYSLIHDDLPAMDDDDLRRGHPQSTRPMTRPPPSLPGMGC